MGWGDPVWHPGTLMASPDPLRNSQLTQKMTECNPFSLKMSPESPQAPGFMKGLSPQPLTWGWPGIPVLVLDPTFISLDSQKLKMGFTWILKTHLRGQAALK